MYNHYRTRNGGRWMSREQTSVSNGPSFADRLLLQFYWT